MLSLDENQIYLYASSLSGILDIRSNQTFILFTYGEMEKELEKSVWEIIIDLQRGIRELEQENKNLRDYADNLDSENDNQAIEIEELKKENKKLKDSNTILEKGWQVVFTLEKKIDELLEENEKLKETIKEHKLYEEKLEHRIVEFEELLHWE